MDEKFNVSTRADPEGWGYLDAYGDRGTEFHVVMDCVGGVVTCTHDQRPVPVSDLPATLRVMLELFSEKTPSC